MATVQPAYVPLSDKPPAYEEHVLGSEEDGITVPQSNGHQFMHEPNGKQANGYANGKKDSMLPAKPTMKHKEETATEIACGLAVNLLSLLFLTHGMIPRARRHTTKFFTLSYYNQATGEYAIGWNDINMIFFYIIVFTGLRAVVIDYLLIPLAEWAGINKRKDKTRFAEQAWIFVYYGAFWSLGMYLLLQHEYWRDFKQLWAPWPYREMGGLFKWYYLVQFAFWLQQIVVVNIEERRKDHIQMFTHHIITCALIFASYGYHQTRVGNLVLCLMDSVDLIFPMAKILKYLHYLKACDIAFGVFMVTWFISRHIIYVMVTYSLYADIPKVVDYGCYYGSNTDLHGPIPVPNDFNHFIQPYIDPEGLVCWDGSVTFVFVSLLCGLQVLLIIWFGMIIRVAARVISGKGADDTRSDDEGEDSHNQNQLHVPRKTDLLPAASTAQPDPIEEEADIESVNLTRRQNGSTNRGKGRKVTANTTGLSIAGQGDRKELLGRIGCEKQI
ncbi:MAG: sphingosine N-acyltransferase lag1 [Cirrosporium novae-zelandiae]|nr:MAG: sphingosine N-acyltransferase lag1 [Cirrosporium novae-zelandiae]